VRAARARCSELRRAGRQWPALPGFEATIRRYFAAMEGLAALLTGCMALGAWRAKFSVVDTVIMRDTCQTRCMFAYWRVSDAARQGCGCTSTTWRQPSTAVTPPTSASTGEPFEHHPVHFLSDSL
jgi:hypothetical protein